MSPDMIRELVTEVFGSNTECAKRVRAETGRASFCRTNVSKYISEDLRRPLPEDIQEFLIDSLDKKIKKLASIKNVVQ